MKNTESGCGTTDRQQHIELKFNINKREIQKLNSILS